MTPETRAHLETLRFRAKEPEGMVGRVEDVEFLFVSHPWKGLAMCVTHVTPRTMTQFEEFLRDAGRPAQGCEVTECSFDDGVSLDIHHIVPRVASRSRLLQVHQAHNLVALCPNHHRIASRFNWQDCAKHPPAEWRSRILAFLNGDSREPDGPTRE